MLARIIIIIVGSGFVGYCITTAVLTILGINPATLHLTKFFQIGYAAINAVLTPFGISGVIGAISRKKTLIRAFVTFQWWLATLILIGLNVFNIILSKRGERDFIDRCQADLAKGQPESNFLDQCTAKVKDAENATFIATCAVGGIMLFVGIVILIVGTREYNNISLEEETKNLLEKANFNEDVETDELRNLSPKTSNFNNNASNIGSDDLVRRVTNVKRQPTKAATINVDLERTNMNSAQNSGLRRNLTDPTGRNQTDMTPLYRNPTLPRNIPPRVVRYPTNANDGPVNRVNLTRQPTIGNANDGPTNTVNLTRQPTIGNANDGPVNRVNVTRQPTIGNANDGPVNRVNVTRQPTIGNTYAPRNYVGTPQPIYPPPQPIYPPPQPKQYMNPPQRSLSTKQYANPLQRSLSTKPYINPPLPPPQMKLPPPPLPDVNEYNYNDEYNNYRPPKPYKQQTMLPYYMGTNQQ